MKFLLALILMLSTPVNAAFYNADVVKVVDGDTLKLDVEIWPGMRQLISLRIYGINTAETRKHCKNSACECSNSFGYAAKDTVEVLAADRVQIYDIRLGKYAGRVLGKVLTMDGVDIGTYLVNGHLAKTYFGGKRGAWCAYK